MPYATRLDLESRYGADEVAQRESALPAGAVDTILADAHAMIDGYLASRYALPLTEVPENLVANACAIARYKLLGDSATERARDDYRDAVAWLRDVAGGRVQLQAAAPLSGGEPASVVMVSSQERVFGRSARP